MSACDTPARAVDSAVLFHISPSGGISTPDMTPKLLQRLLDQGAFTGESLTSLMVDAATRAAEDADRRVTFLHGQIAYSLNRLNASIDSASLQRFIDSLEEEASS